MLRTNSKQVVEKIDSYIRETAADYIRDQYTEDGETYIISGRVMDLNERNDLAAVILDIFKEEYLKHNPQYAAGRVSRWDLFKDWAAGLALGGTFLYYYNVSAVDLLGDILEETEEERNRYSERAAEELLTKLIYRQLTTRADIVL